MSSTQNNHERKNRIDPSMIFIGLGVVFTLSAMGLFLWTKIGESGKRTNPVPPKVGQPMPNFMLNDLEGSKIRLSDYKGRPVLVNFWATWCPPCKREMPGLVDFYHQHREEGFTVLAVNVGETSEQAASFVNEMDIDFPVLLDQNYEVSDQLMVDNFPMSILVGRDGYIKLIHIGYFSPEDLSNKLIPLLE